MNQQITNNLTEAVAAWVNCAIRQLDEDLCVPKTSSVLIDGRIAYRERDARSARFHARPPGLAVQVAERA
jgi:hypothetical protein